MGPIARSVTIMAGEAVNVDLSAGHYTIAAEAVGSTVLPFYGEQDYEATVRYRERFYGPPQASAKQTLPMVQPDQPAGHRPATPPDSAPTTDPDVPLKSYSLWHLVTSGNRHSGTLSLYPGRIDWHESGSAKKFVGVATIKDDFSISCLELKGVHTAGVLSGNDMLSWKLRLTTTKKSYVFKATNGAERDYIIESIDEICRARRR